MIADARTSLSFNRLGPWLVSVHCTPYLVASWTSRGARDYRLVCRNSASAPWPIDGDSEVPIYYEDLVRCICILSGYQPSVYSFFSLAKCLAMLNEPETYDCDPNPPFRVSTWDICWTLVTLVVYAPLSVLSSLCNPSTVLRWSAVKEQIGHNLLLWCVLAKQDPRGSIAY